MPEGVENIWKYIDTLHSCAVLPQDSLQVREKPIRSDVAQPAVGLNCSGILHSVEVKICISSQAQHHI
jgi:hypothetical protein